MVRMGGRKIDLIISDLEILQIVEPLTKYFHSREFILKLFNAFSTKTIAPRLDYIHSTGLMLQIGTVQRPRVECSKRITRLIAYHLASKWTSMTNIGRRVSTFYAIDEISTIYNIMDHI